jgi:hypothetical protein
VNTMSDMESLPIEGASALTRRKLSKQCNFNAKF